MRNRSALVFSLSPKRSAARLRNASCAFSRTFAPATDLIEGMRVGQEQIRAEAARLGNSLTNAPKARGRWGERALQNVLEQCGLSEHTDFHLEHSIDTEDGR